MAKFTSQVNKIVWMTPKSWEWECPCCKKWYEEWDYRSLVMCEDCNTSFCTEKDC